MIQTSGLQRYLVSVRAPKYHYLLMQMGKKTFYLFIGSPHWDLNLELHTNPLQHFTT